jgi:aminoglycoside phosphotransferase (APT) family kinase protein
LVEGDVTRQLRPVQDGTMTTEEPTISTPWRSDPAAMTERIEAWWTAQVTPGATVTEVTAPEGSGMSSETLLFTVQPADGPPERYVARLAPLASQQFPVFPQYDLELQRRVMQTVGEHTEVPVPEVITHETDPEWLGSPFLLMRRIDGVVPSDIPPYTMAGWLFDAEPEQQRTLERESVRVLARLHDLTPTRHDLAFLDRPQFGRSALDQHLGYQRWYYDWAREGQRVPLIERTFRALDRTRPEESPTVLNWGDSRIGNMMFRDFAPAAVLDWEMAALGPAEIDVGWMTFMHRFFEDLTRKYGMPCLDDFLQRERVAELYAEESGRQVRDLEWYEMFAAQRFAIVSIRTTWRTVAYGDAEAPEDLDDVIMFRALLEEMVARAEAS